MQTGQVFAQQVTYNRIVLNTAMDRIVLNTAMDRIVLNTAMDRIVLNTVMVHTCIPTYFVYIKLIQWNFSYPNTFVLMVSQKVFR